LTTPFGLVVAYPNLPSPLKRRAFTSKSTSGLLLTADAVLRERRVGVAGLERRC
jgi:hypothetical protein